ITHILTSRMVKENVCEVDLKLDTGRTHQIRVHLAEIGHPVIGDPLYGDSTLRQLQLNSYKIEFIHPLTQEKISVSLDDEIKICKVTLLILFIDFIVHTLLLLINVIINV